MKTIKTHSKIGSDGLLKLNVPTSEKNTEVDVVIVIESSKKKKTWPKNFIAETFGSLKDTPIQRPDQGKYPDRDELI